MSRAGKRGGFCVLFIAALVGWCVTGDAQTRHPRSLDFSQGVHVYAYDGLEHKSADHYENLCRIVMDEFGLPADSISVVLVFVDAQLQEKLNANNRERFQSTSWYGVCISPSLIFMLGEDESDDTFMHEYLHSLNQRGLLFTDVRAVEVHHLIEINEGLLLGSKSYLEYLKTKPKTPDKSYHQDLPDPARPAGGRRAGTKTQR